MSLVGTVNFDYWLDDVLPCMTGQEIELAIKHIRGAAIDFCEHSLAWRLDALPIDVIADQRQYMLVSPYDDTEIVQVLHAYLNYKELPVNSTSALAQRNINFLSQQGTPTCYVQEFTERMSLYPMPNSNFSASLTYKVALRPSRVANGMHDSIGKKYFEAIAHGAKARLYEMPGKPWTDGNLSIYHRAKFDMIATRARDEAASGYGRGVKRVVSHY